MRICSKVQAFWIIHYIVPEIDGQSSSIVFGCTAAATKQQCYRTLCYGCTAQPEKSEANTAMEPFNPE